jgi:peptide/nickel transport system ATP-binding protein
MSVLNPIQTIGQSMLEMIRAHEGQGAKAPREERCRQLLRQVSLQPDVLKAYPFELSGGMMQRVSIAIAILYRPKLLIMDEATTGLDVLTEADLLGEIRRLKRQENMSILMISHDQILSDAFCDRRIEIGGFHG